MEGRRTCILYLLFPKMEEGKIKKTEKAFEKGKKEKEGRKQHAACLPCHDTLALLYAAMPVASVLVCAILSGATPQPSLSLQHEQADLPPISLIHPPSWKSSRKIACVACIDMPYA